jgi:hypothetical protein
MATRIRSRMLAVSLPAGGRRHILGPSAGKIHRQNVNLSQPDIIATRSAELCAAHGNGPNTSESIAASVPSRRSCQSLLSGCGTDDPKRARICPILCGELLEVCWGDLGQPPPKNRQLQEREPSSLVALGCLTGWNFGEINGGGVI